MISGSGGTTSTSTGGVTAAAVGDTIDDTAVAYQTSYVATASTSASGITTVNIVDSAHADAVVGSVMLSGGFSGDTFVLSIDGASGTDISIQALAGPVVVPEEASAGIAGLDGLLDNALGTAGVTGTGALVGDSDTTGSPLTVTAVVGGTVSKVFGGGTYFATEYGVLKLAADGSYDYEVNPTKVEKAPTGAPVTDTVLYTVTDGNGLSATAPITFTDYRDPSAVPEVVDVKAGATARYTAGTSGTGALEGDSDPDGVAPSVEAVDASSNIVSNPIAGAYGTLSLNADGSFSYAADSQAALAAAFAANAYDPIHDVFNLAVQGGGGTATSSTLTVEVDPTVLYETASAIAALTQAGITQLVSQGYTGVVATDAMPTLTGTQAVELAAAGLTVGYPTGRSTFTTVTGLPYTTVETDYDANGNITKTTDFNADGSIYTATPRPASPGRT
jgi:VCBS repeat-containing protein